MILIMGNHEEEERSHFTDPIDQLGNRNDKLPTNVCAGGYRKHTTTHPHYAKSLCLCSNLFVRKWPYFIGKCHVLRSATFVWENQISRNCCTKSLVWKLMREEVSHQMRNPTVFWKIDPHSSNHNFWKRFT